MTQELPHIRPNCQQILKDKHLWALNENEFEFENELSLILKSEENSERNFVYSILELKFIAMKNKLKTDVDSNSREEEELHIMTILNDYKHRQTLVENCLKYLYKNILKSNGYKPKTDFIDLIVILMRKHSQSFEIQIFGTACICVLLKEELEIEKLDMNLVNKLIEVILTSMESFMESFPNNKPLFNNALIILNKLIILNLLQNASFDRYKCIKLSIDSLIKFKDMDMNRNAVIICLILVERIKFSEKKNLSSNPIYSETLLEIVESLLHSYVNYEYLIDLSLVLIHKLNIDSYGAIEKHILDKLIEATLMAIDLYPNEQILSVCAIGILFFILIIRNDPVLNSKSFNKYKCIQLVMNLLNERHAFNSNDMKMIENAVTICSTLFQMISSDEKSKLSSNATNNKTLLKIVESCLHSNTNNSDLLVETLNFILFLNSDSFAEIETQILKKLVKVTQIVLVLFPNHIRLSNCAITILFPISIKCSDSILESISFDRYKCIQLVMQSMINFKLNDKDSHLTDQLNYRSDIIRIILDYEKLNTSSKPIYVKTLLEIIRIIVRHEIFDNKSLLECCLTNISTQTIEILVKHRVFDLYFRVLKVCFKIYNYSIIQFISYVPGIHGSDRCRKTSVGFHFQDLNYF
jgi:hypothetical protein